jgi:hypothetical protein
MKKIYFLTGLPRAGNTLLGSLINQNKNISVTANSILCDVLINLYFIKESLTFKNFPDHSSFNNILKNVFNNYYSDWKCNYILDRGPWGTPINLKILKQIFNEPKFIILYRPVLEVLASFVKSDKYENIDNYCDSLMDLKKNPNAMIGKNILSIYNIIKNQENYIIIHYKDLVKNPSKQINKIHDFLNLPYENINLENFNQFSSNGIFYDDNVLASPLHKIKTEKIENPTYKIEQFLPKNIIEKYSGLDIL